MDAVVEIKKGETDHMLRVRWLRGLTFRLDNVHELYGNHVVIDAERIGKV